MIRARAMAMLLAVCGLRFATAEVLFFSGDYDAGTALASEINTLVSDARPYVAFDVGGNGWRVDGLFGKFLLTPGPMENAYWEIRQGVRAGFGGTLIVAQGNFRGPVRVEKWGPALFGMRQYLCRGPIRPVSLPPGEYFMTVAIVGKGVGRAFAVNTLGTNGIGRTRQFQDTYFDSRFFGYNFAPMEEIIGFDVEVSFGVEGRRNG